MFKDPLIVFERDVEGLVLTPVIAMTGDEIDAASTQKVKRGPLLGNADRMVKWKHRHGRGET